MKTHTKMTITKERDKGKPMHACICMHLFWNTPFKYRCWHFLYSSTADDVTQAKNWYSKSMYGNVSQCLKTVNIKKDYINVKIGCMFIQAQIISWHFT